MELAGERDLACRNDEPALVAGFSFSALRTEPGIDRRRRTVVATPTLDEVGLAIASLLGQLAKRDYILSHREPYNLSLSDEILWAG